MFLIYFALLIVAFVVTYFCISETKGLPVEEIGALFGDEVVVHLTSDGLGIVEDKEAVTHVEDDAVHNVEKL